LQTTVDYFKCFKITLLVAFGPLSDTRYSVSLAAFKAILLAQKRQGMGI
jgi:hypothetical protein